MTKLNLLFIVIASFLCSCKSVKNKDLATEKKVIETRIDTTSIKANTMDVTDQGPTAEDLIQAFEKQIKFFKTASKGELVEFLGISPARVELVSDKEFDDMVRDENAYLYENLTESLKKDESEFEVLSREDNFYTVSIKEKRNNSMELRMNFENTENGFVVARKNR